MNPETAWEWLLFILTLCGRFKRPKVLLIVDDNASDAEMLQIFILRLKYKTETVDTAEAGLALLKDRHHPIAFIDVRLPMMSGMSMIERIRSISPKTHIVVVCGEVGDLMKLPKGRHFSVIIKPVSLESVEDCVRQARI